jgi:endonuclease YncB( thermonuclease family)
VVKARVKGEWKLWAGVAVILLALVVYLYLESRPPKEGGEYLWTVTRIIDERTMLLKGSGQTIEFRLVGLEVPASQAQAVRDLLKQTLLNDKWVRIKPLRENSKGVKEGFIFISGEDLHARLIRQGLATVDRKEKGFDVRTYIELELEAKREKRGLWSRPESGAR